MDWHIRRTFKFIQNEQGHINTISKSDLRKLYMAATENHSQASFIDFITRCKFSGFLVPDRPHRPVSFEIKKFKEALDA